VHAVFVVYTVAFAFKLVVFFLPLEAIAVIATAKMPAGLEHPKGIVIIIAFYMCAQGIICSIQILTVTHYYTYIAQVVFKLIILITCYTVNHTTGLFCILAQ